MLLRLSRARKHDTSLQAAGDVSARRRRVAGGDEPKLGIPRNVPPEEAYRELPLPPVSTRQALNARDPVSSVHRYDVAIRVILSRIAGTRMCMQCPDCNVHWNEVGRLGCQNQFGNNALPLGGSAG